MLGDRAEAMAAYLEEVHWGPEETTRRNRGDQEAARDNTIASTVKDRVEKHLEKCRQTAVMNLEMDRIFEIEEMNTQKETKLQAQKT